MPASKLFFRIFSLFILFLMPFGLSFSQEYVLLGWNDLGMHCSNKYFGKIAVLPPYNNVTAQLILKLPDQLPQIVTSNYTIEYSIPNNTYSVGKTDFWTYAQQLFGLPNPLPANIGLTGKGLTGILDSAGAYFITHGIPVTPFPDSDHVHESPFQLIHLVAKSRSSGDTLATTDAVIPVSNEVGCVQSGCHSSEANILNSHETVPNFNPAGPVLCASCHSSNALGTPGIPEARSFSFRMHDKHKDVAGPKNSISTCYKCHPGPNTQCLRDIMGKNPNNPLICQNCHGTMDTLAASISNGRRPWLDEPKCGNCHGSAYAEQPGKLYRQSTGHGGLFCSACHGSPHAIQPTVQANDNIQNTRLQGFSGTLRKCSVCHSTHMTSPGPHGIMDTTTAIAAIPVLSSPPNGIYGITTNPLLLWNPAQNAQVYGVELATDTLFNTLIREDSSIAQTSLQLSSLDSARKYFWHVRSKNQAGTSAWSETWSFSTGSGSTYTYSVGRYWNMVSLPLTVEIPLVQSQFPTASSNAFEYAGGLGYVMRDTLRIGKGYWLKFNSSELVNLTGTKVSSETLAVSDGWNIIGSISDTIPTSSITSTPQGIIASVFYGYNGSYIPADFIIPAKGFWVKSAGPGQLILSHAAGAAMKNQSAPASEILNSCDKITIRDAALYQQTLYLSNRPSEGIPPSYFGLPPVPPEGAFDARFESGQLLETYQAGQAARIPISLTGASFPVTVIWQMRSDAGILKLEAGGAEIALNASGSVQIEDKNSLMAIIVEASAEIPREFTLEQNYPNPFNPSTTFRYGLPERSQVRLAVYNLLGQKVQEIVNSTQDAGYHEIQWFPTNGSGLYYYRLDAVSSTDAGKTFTNIRKMLLLR